MYANTAIAKRTLGDVAPAGTILGMQPQTFQTVALIAGGVLLGAVVLNFAGEGIASHYRRKAQKRARRRAYAKQLFGVNSVWPMLLVGAAGAGAAYYFSKRQSGVA